MADTSRVDPDILDTVLKFAGNANEGLLKQIARTVQAERERCALVVERSLGRTNTYIVNAIRSGDAP